MYVCMTTTTAVIAVVICVIKIPGFLQKKIKIQLKTS